jgi:hypothetical protein
MFKDPKDLVVGLLDPFFANEWLTLVLKCCLLPSQELDPHHKKSIISLNVITIFSTLKEEFGLYIFLNMNVFNFLSISVHVFLVLLNVG